MSQLKGYCSRMKAKRTHTGFGLYDLSRQIARRRQRAADILENWPPRPPMALTPESEHLRDLFTYAEQFKRQLAA